MKKIIPIILSIFVVLGLAGCSKKSDDAGASGNSKVKKVIKVGATAQPHAEILEKVKPILEKEGYGLDIVEFSDYSVINTALSEGQLDADFFQHIPYLKKTITEKGYKLDYTVKVHIEPMGVYSRKVKNLDDLKDGATISVPNDPTNEARALRVLESAGLIELTKDADVTVDNITKNPKNIKFEELDAAQLPRTLDENDAAVINTNYALPAGLNPVKDAIKLESSSSPYANILAVKAEDKDKDYIKALSDALNTPEIKKFIEDNYKGNIIPAF